MQSWIILLVGLLLFVWTVYGRKLLNRAVWVKHINPSILQSYGDMKVYQDTIQVKFFWSIKTFSFRQIAQIKAYSQTDWGLEEYEQVDILFENGNKLYFSGSLQEHRDIIQVIVSAIGIQDKTWTWGFLPHLGDKMSRDIVYKRTDESR